MPRRMMYMALFSVRSNNGINIYARAGRWRNGAGGWRHGQRWRRRCAASVAAAELWRQAQPKNGAALK